MVSKLLDEEIVIASHNKGKIIEFADLFKDYQLNLFFHPSPSNHQP